MDANQLQAVLTSHSKWLRGEADGSRANLAGANLAGADLTGADLTGADLAGAILTGAILTDAYLTQGIPIVVDIHGELLRAIETEGHALDMSDWHRCKTTHCRAGWVITLAGEAGRALEATLGPGTAAALIYQASDPSLDRIPDFYATNEEAMKDIRQMANRDRT